MYANQQEAPPVVPPIPTPGKYGDCAVGGKAQSPGFGFASSSPTGAGGLGQYPYCNLDCDDQDYGKNCYRWGNTPGKTERFITYNHSNNCTPAAAPQGFVNGAYPWLGNPMGNTTTGSLCNTFPNVIAPTPTYDQCTNRPGPYTAWSPGSQNITQYCVQYVGDSGTPPNKAGVYRCMPAGGPFCLKDGPSIKTIPGFWSLHVPDPADPDL